jgi:hypothetical protein
MPAPLLYAIRFASPSANPPIGIAVGSLVPFCIWTPPPYCAAFGASNPFGSGWVPLQSVPM